MIMHRLFAALMVGALSVGSCFATSDSLVKKRVLSDLDTIHHIFEVKYAPLQWKGEYVKWQLHEAIQEAKSKVESLANPTLKECQVIVRDFFNSTRDYHVGVRFYSTESASLPFLVKGGQKRYFVCEVYDEESAYRFPFDVGDEILTFDGRPIHEVVEELRETEYGSNNYGTDLALAEMTLTFRHGAHGNRIPRGPVVITGRRLGEERVISAKLEWDYTAEKIRDFSNLGKKVSVEFEGRSDFRSTIKKSQFFEKFMIFHQIEKGSLRKGCEMSLHTLGSRTSYLPRLGNEIWETDSGWNFDAYIFQTRSGKRVGYIRIPHYMADIEELEEFGEIMNIFQRKTEALIIDQINNPGGDAFYIYALVSTLADRPYYAPKHHITLTQEEVQTALSILYYLEQVDDESSARAVLGDDMGGYPIDYEFACVLKKFCNFIIDQWNSGKIYTDPTHLFGVDKIKPHPQYKYSKPILLLINTLNFSGGDFFPAILQDNKRATLMGTNTAGAGGYVLHTNFPNHSGIELFKVTGSIARRVNQQPLENLGVKPDIYYELTPEDLQSNYQPFARAIVKNVEALIK